MTTTTTPTRWSGYDTIIVVALMAMAAAVFLTGIAWGLPSREADQFLFGGRQPWSGEDIVRLAPEPAADENRGADVDANPIVDRRQPVLLNGTDAQRAEIVRRYRLFSYHPDEMITFKSLSGMSPGRLDLDPRLYQYGGLWIYPVGALLKFTSLVGLTDVRADKAFYLDHPEEFGKFYVVARCYSAAWAVAGLAVVYWLARRITGSRGAAAAAAMCYAWLPAVVNAAHEAKPHMAGAVLMLAAVAAGARYVDTGVRRWAWMAGGLAGASVGMVVSGLWAFAALPVMVILRPAAARERIRHLLQATACGVGVYVVTNPYVAINAVMRPSRLTSNLQNSTAMYAVGGSSNAIVNAAWLIAEGASIVIAIAGTLAVVVLAARLLGRVSDDEEVGNARHTRAPLMLLAVVAGIVLVQFVLLAAGKPGEYGRFALVPDIALAIAAVSAVAGAKAAIGPIIRGILLTLLALAAVPFGAEYVYAFQRDCRPITSRLRAGQELASMPGAIGLRDEPAPYLMPPVDLFGRDLVLLPKGQAVTAPVNYTLSAIDGVAPETPGQVLLPSRWRRGTLWLSATRISWANKRFELTPVRGFVADASVTRTGPAGSNRP